MDGEGKDLEGLVGSPVAWWVNVASSVTVGAGAWSVALRLIVDLGSGVGPLIVSEENVDLASNSSASCAPPASERGLGAKDLGSFWVRGTLQHEENDENSTATEFSRPSSEQSAG